MLAGTRVGRRFARCAEGNIAVIFGFSLPVLIGSGGLAIDYGNAARFRSVASHIADATALLVAASPSAAAETEALKLANAQLVSTLGSDGPTGDYRVEGQWQDANNYRVVVTLTMRTSLIHLIPGLPKTMEIGSAATANRTAIKVEAKKPTITRLEPNAADYNRLHIYCYSSDPKRQAQADKGRRGLVAISDNGQPPTDYSGSKVEQCEADEIPSFMIYNVRWARSDKSKWEDRNQERYQAFADTTRDEKTGVLTITMFGQRLNSNGSTTTIDLKNYKILETIVCDTLEQCKPRSEGGILPNANTAHQPATATQPCAPGKYMYYGWEDRPDDPKNADFDDTRTVVACPQRVAARGAQLRLVE